MSFRTILVMSLILVPLPSDCQEPGVAEGSDERVQKRLGEVDSLDARVREALGTDKGSGPRFQEARKLLQSIVEIARETENERLLAATFVRLGSVYSGLEEAHSAVRYYSLGDSVAGEIGDRFNQIQALARKGVVMVRELGDTVRGRRSLDRAITECSHASNPPRITCGRVKEIRDSLVHEVGYEGGERP